MHSGGGRTSLADAAPGASTSPSAVVMGRDAHAVSSVRAKLESLGITTSGYVPGATGTPIGVIAVVIHSDEAAWREAARQGLPRVVVFDDEPDDVAFADALRHGATGAISSSALTLLLSTIRPTETFAPALTPREVDVLRSIQDGKSVKETGEALGISPRTVDNVQRFLFTKLGVRNRRQAVARCHELGLFDADGGE